MTWHQLVLNFFLAVLLGAVTLACKDTTKGASAPGATNQQIFQVKGVVKEVEPARKKVKIAHEEIPGYMEAMTMLLDVKDAKELAGLSPGDNISFRMIVTDDDGWVDQIKKLGATSGVVAPVVSSAPDNFRRVREVEPLKVGDAMPDYRFTNQLGQAVSLRDFKGQALAFTFIFTRCPFPTFCPRMSSNFADAHKQLQALTNGPANWHLLTISFDPEFDTPATLANYAKRFKHDPKHWSFVTGELIDVTAISEQFGLMFWKEGGNINHNLRTVVVDAAGRVQKVYTENEWKVDDLVSEMVKAAAAKP